MYCPGATTDKAPLKVTGDVARPRSHDTARPARPRAPSSTPPTSTPQPGCSSTPSSRWSRRSRAPTSRPPRTPTSSRAPYYEHIEPVAESFTVGKQNLDADIDARAGDVPASQWQGFHCIEKGLFEDKSLAGLAPYGDELLANVKKLHGLVKGLTYQPAELANGAVGLLDEVAKSKITGEEERYSHIDLLDFQANVEGSQQAFACLQPGLAKIDPALADDHQRRRSRPCRTLLDTYRSTTTPRASCSTAR